MQRFNNRQISIGVGVLILLGAAFWGLTGKKDTSQKGDPRQTAVEVAEAKAVNFPVSRQAIALVESPATVTILSRIDSQLIEQHVRDGQIVEKGDLLFVLDDREIKATIAKDQATIDKDEALLAQSLADLSRAQALLAKNSASQQQVDQATANQKSAAAVLDADKAILESDKLKLSYTRIYAPISGRVGSVRVTPGNLVKANDSSGGGLVTITQIQPLRVTFALPERDLPLLRKATDQKIVPEVKISAPNGGATAVGKLDFLDNMVDSSSGTITVKASFPNDERKFWPGQYVQIEAVLGQLDDVILVPTVALQMGQKGPYVFVALPDGKAGVRDVQIIGSDNVNSAISGLKAGEQIIVEGHNRLSEGAAINIVNKPSQPTPNTENGDKQ
ncbi:efflux RND transporter periplasmic adaptor subunit [Microvirga sp. W0021]|uniref:Efflux RND transporter periplasmic adaptor subunit n=1 Tax=Hohaiivirga grylli TaxID=3133970 RepID=A0ABV0BGZ2_9HYPH